jgi:diguanylate cyclase (GGDEF)-like protein
MEHTGDHGVWEWDLDSERVRWSEGIYQIYGVSPHDFVPSVESIRHLIHDDDHAAYRDAVIAAIATRQPFLIQHRIVRPDGDERTLLQRGAVIGAGDGKGRRLVGTTQDVTGAEGADDHLRQLAHYDALTGLFNRRRFIDELTHEIADAKRTNEGGAVVMLDLERFKEINDSLGNAAGDALLVRVGEVMRVQLRETDRLARLGGDEFALLLPRCSLTEARNVAGRVIFAIGDGAPVKIAGHEHVLSASAGLVSFGGAAQSADELLVAADLAVGRSKRRGGGQVEVYNEEMRTELAARIRDEAELLNALEFGQIDAYYQPIISLEDGTVVGCEALARWHHPSRGVVAPGDFIPIAEEHGLLGRIGVRILEQACRQAHLWRSVGPPKFVSVNVSPVELLHEDVVANVTRLLAETQLPAELLQLEITENLLTDDAAEIRPVLDALKEIGVRLAIDDFGGGTSSLSSLNSLPIDVIKIDQGFIAALDDGGDEHAITTAVISLASELGLPVVAEGVETERQHAILRELGCGYAQGFLYARPVPAPELRLGGYEATVRPPVEYASPIRGFMRRLGIPTKLAH